MQKTAVLALSAALDLDGTVGHDADPLTESDHDVVRYV
jgi:hypothetical protein